MHAGTNLMPGHASSAIEADSQSGVLISRFLKRMKLLIADTDTSILASLATAFSTPLVDVKTASDANQATNAISRSSCPWHTWIFDISLGKRGCEGLEIIEKHQHYPFVIVHSGIGSMEKAAHAIRLGVAEVIDKTAESVSRLIEKTCALLPLGMLCKGRLLKSRGVFFTLAENVIMHHREWAERVNLSLRQLENVCNLHTDLTPSLVLPFYYGMRYLLQTTIDLRHMPVEYVVNERFFLECIEFVARRIEGYMGISI
jgi:DNA-binding NarL/FixJ family response regulator